MQGPVKLGRSSAQLAPLEVVRRTYSVGETAIILGVGKSTLYGAVERGEIPAVRIGRRRMIPKNWVEKQATGQAKEPSSEV
ncbi:helix-turn-helix domain-containing protein [Tardiphaga sp. 42S5]|uniref:helix-turn-helix domain-containing protein n=1 Tax=Tardiphaga sp. 42S5 TaxID=1404799 RepID=UPI0039C90A12